jgi:PAS domain S-box-containing protein
LSLLNKLNENHFFMAVNNQISINLVNEPTADHQLIVSLLVGQYPNLSLKTTNDYGQLLKNTTNEKIDLIIFNCITNGFIEKIIQTFHTINKSVPVIIITADTLNYKHIELKNYMFRFTNNTSLIDQINEALESSFFKIQTGSTGNQKEPLGHKNKAHFADMELLPLINCIHEGIGICEPMGRIQLANNKLNSIFGFEDGELTGKSIREFIDDSEIFKLFNERNKNLKDEKFNCDIKLLINEKESKNVNITLTPFVLSNSISGFLILVVDITNKDKIKKELDRRYDYERCVFKISSKFVNQENFDQKLNESLKELGQLGKADRTYFVEIDHEKKTCKVINSWTNIGIENETNIFNNLPLRNIGWAIEKLAVSDHFFIRDIESIPEDEFKIKEYYRLNKIKNFMAFPVFMGDNILGFVGLSNITSFEETTGNEFVFLRSGGEIITNAIQRHYSDISLKKLNHQLATTKNEMEQLLYVTSHDIRSPLVNIIGFTRELTKAFDEVTEIIGKETFTDEDKKNIIYLIKEDIPESIKYINASSYKIDKLLSALLKLSRLGRANVEYSSVDMDKMIDEIINSFQFQIETEKIRVIKKNLHPCTADKQLINQIFSNLIDNAVKYHDPEKQGYIEISSRVNDGKVIYYITDNGLGIPKDKKNSIFDIFTRLHPYHAEGEGMGLTIIKKGLERMNGKISVESIEGSGSTFIIELPYNL